MLSPLAKCSSHLTAPLYHQPLQLGSRPGTKRPVLFATGVRWSVVLSNCGECLVTPKASRRSAAQCSLQACWQHLALAALLTTPQAYPLAPALCCHLPRNDQVV